MIRTETKAELRQYRNLPYDEYYRVDVFWRNWYLNMAIKWITGPCLFCGEENPNLLEWNHIKPEDKVFKIADILRCERSLYLHELPKLVLLCKRCHVKYHENPVQEVTDKLTDIHHRINSYGLCCGMTFEDLHDLCYLYTRHGLSGWIAICPS